jgi:hypothetical protein
VKPILGLLVLLACPCLGLGGRAQAGFALGGSALAPERAPGSLGLEFQLVLNGGEPAEPEGPPTSAPAEEDAPLPPGDSPRAPAAPVHLLPVPGGTSSGAPSSGAGSGGGLSVILPSNPEALGGDPTGRLFLADERLHPPPFASRLFRPPRLVREALLRPA